MMADNVFDSCQKDCSFDKKEAKQLGIPKCSKGDEEYGDKCFFDPACGFAFAEILPHVQCLDQEVLEAGEAVLNACGFGDADYYEDDEDYYMDYVARGESYCEESDFNKKDCKSQPICSWHDGECSFSGSDEHHPYEDHYPHYPEYPQDDPYHHYPYSNDTGYDIPYPYYPDEDHHYDHHDDHHDD